jgi:hypothetical protein
MTQSVEVPSVHVIAVPGFGMDAPAPQRFVPAPVHCVGAIPYRLVAVAPVPVTAVGGVVPRMANTAKASSPAAGEMAMVGFVEIALAVVPPVVGVEVETPRSKTVAQMCFAVPLDSVAVIVCAPPGITPW